MTMAWRLAVAPSCMHVCVPLCMQLKDEVVLLKAAVRTRDSKLAEAEETAADLKADLLESKQQVGADWAQMHNYRQRAQPSSTRCLAFAHTLWCCVLCCTAWGLSHESSIRSALCASALMSCQRTWKLHDQLQLPQSLHKMQPQPQPLTKALQTLPQQQQQQQGRQLSRTAACCLGRRQEGLQQQQMLLLAASSAAAVKVPHHLAGRSRSWARIHLWRRCMRRWAPQAGWLWTGAYSPLNEGLYPPSTAHRLDQQDGRFMHSVHPGL